MERTSTSTVFRPVPDGPGPLLVVYGLWSAIAIECIGALLILRAPIESIVAVLFSYRQGFQIFARYRFEATYLLAIILIGGLLFAFCIVAEHSLRSAIAWSHTYQKPFYPEVLRRFVRNALLPASLVVFGVTADLLILRFS